MGWGVLSAPGGVHGPCSSACEHVDCAAGRRMAASLCRICGKPIGYEVRFYAAGDGFEHAVCVEDRADREDREEKHT